jgi:hypothetical protein
MKWKYKFLIKNVTSFSLCSYSIYQKELDSNQLFNAVDINI